MRCRASRGEIQKVRRETERRKDNGLTRGKNTEGKRLSCVKNTQRRREAEQQRSQPWPVRKTLRWCKQKGKRFLRARIEKEEAIYKESKKSESTVSALSPLRPQRSTSVVHEIEYRIGLNMLQYIKMDICEVNSKFITPLMRE